MLDARFLPNPYWVPELREHTGREAAVSAYVLGQEGADEFVDTYADLVNATTAGFEREGKRYLTVAVGCTGGKHRSVAIAEELAERLRRRGWPPTRSTGTWGASNDAAPDRRVVAFGGGHGLSRLAAGAAPLRRRLDLDITAVVTVGDDGGSSGRLRRERGGLPPGDLRQALAALAGDDAGDPAQRGAVPAPVRRRHPGRAGRPRGGQPGALWPDGAARRPGRRAGRTPAAMLGAVGRVLPMSAPAAGHRGPGPGRRPGRPRRGTHRARSAPGGGDHRPGRGVAAHPGRPAGLCRGGGRRSRGADWLIFGPGSWYTSVLPHLLVPGLADGDRGQPGPAAGHPQPGRRAGDPGLSVGRSPGRPALVPSASSRWTRAGRRKAVGDPEPVGRAAESLGARLVLAPVAVDDGTPRHDPAAPGRRTGACPGRRSLSTYVITGDDAGTGP